MSIKLEKSQLAGIIIALVLIGTGLIWALSNKNKLLAVHKITNALVNDCYSGGRGYLGTTILYKFALDGKEVNGSAAFSYNALNLSNAKAYILGKTFPVVYDPQHPLNNLILIRQKDFMQFSIPMPDSLRWLLKYVH